MSVLDTFAKSAADRTECSRFWMAVVRLLWTLVSMARLPCPALHCECNGTALARVTCSASSYLNCSRSPWWHWLPVSGALAY
jgi:hypothetical protein